MMKNILTTLMLFISIITFGQLNDPSPYCEITYWGGQYNMINTLDVEGVQHSFGAQGSPFANDDFVYQNSYIFPDFIKGNQLSFSVDFYSIDDGEPILFGVFIDFNQNNVFDANELVMSNHNTIMEALPSFGAPTVVATLDVTIPTTALTGKTRMRIIREEGAYPYSNTAPILPCLTNTSYVCYYDFDVKIADASSGVLATAITIEGENNSTEISSIGGTLQLTASVLPLNVDNSNVTWSISSGAQNATIDNAGLLTAVSQGTVVVKATAEDGSGVFGEKTFTISEKATDIDIVDINDINVFQNISNKYITIQSDYNIQSFKVFDVVGKLILKNEKLILKNIRIDLNSLKKGIYFISLEINHKNVIKKVQVN